ncbi:MAG: HEAT repeat domain-containing protein [Chloroflexi bacterium]|nr:HEAT repeat domain-containing protein [Chloroflexota bacterium]
MMLDVYSVAWHILAPPRENMAMLQDILRNPTGLLRGYYVCLLQNEISLPPSITTGQEAVMEHIKQAVDDATFILDRVKSGQYQSGEDVTRFWEDVRERVERLRIIAAELPPIDEQIDDTSAAEVGFYTMVSRYARIIANSIQIATDPDWVPPSHIADWIAVRDEVKDLVERADVAALPHLLAAMENPAPSIRAQVTHLLWEFEHPDAVPLLLELTMDPNADVRDRAFSALARKPGVDQEVVGSTLMRLMSDENEYVRRAAIWKLYTASRTGVQ